jgi:hypothetical protein
MGNYNNNNSQEDENNAFGENHRATEGNQTAVVSVGKIKRSVNNQNNGLNSNSNHILNE